MAANTSAGEFRHQATLQDVQRREFKHGIRIQADQQALLRPGSSDPTPLSALVAADAAPLAHKDLAVYDAALGGEQRPALFDALWRAWLPLRPRAVTDGDAGANAKLVLRTFFAVSFSCYGRHDTEAWAAQTEAKPEGQQPGVSAEALAWLVRWHEGLCARAAEIAAESGGDGEHQLPGSGLEDSFRRGFAVADRADWAEVGLLACARVQDAGGLFGVSPADAVALVGGESGWGCWRIGAGRLVQAVRASQAET